MTSDITWGPEIAVNGKPPEWLDAKTPCDIKENFAWFDTTGEMQAEDWCWSPVKAIRLPANHPHYATLSHPTAPIPSDVGREVVFSAEQAEMLRGVLQTVTAQHGSRWPEAAACLALLPEPVDADLVEARRIAVEQLTAPGQSEVFLGLIADGTNDHYSEVRIALAAIKRGRALEKGDRANG